MNQQTSWENVQKSHKKHLKVISISVITVAVVAAVIILNNEDLLSGKSEHSSNPIDTATFSFGTADSSGDIRGDENADIKTESTNQNSDISVAIDTFESTDKDRAQKEKSSKKNGSEKDLITEAGHTEIRVHQEIKKSATSPVSTSHISQVKERVPKDQMMEQHPNHNPPEIKQPPEKNLNSHQTEVKEQFFLLPNIQTRVIDRKDLLISMALELFYNDSISESDIRLHRDALRVVAVKVLYGKELASLKKDILAADFEREMNGIFERKTLSKVRIREFQIEKVSEQ